MKQKESIPKGWHVMTLGVLSCGLYSRSAAEVETKLKSSVLSLCAKKYFKIFPLLFLFSHNFSNSMQICVYSGLT